MAKPPATDAKPPAKRRNGAITKAQRERFLDLIREGADRAAAAKEVGSTGTKFRGLCFRDAAFADLYRAAFEEGHQTWVDDELRPTFKQLATDGKNPRATWQAMLVYTPEGRAFQTVKHRHEHDVNGRVEVAHVVEHAADSLRAKLAPVLELPAASSAEEGGS